MTKPTKAEALKLADLLENAPGVAYVSRSTYTVNRAAEFLRAYAAQLADEPEPPKVETLREAAERIKHETFVHSLQHADLCAIVLRRYREHLLWHDRNSAGMSVTVQVELRGQIAEVEQMLEGGGE